MTGNKLIDNIILGLSALVCAGALGIFVYTEILYQKPRINNEVEKEKMMEEGKKQVFPSPFKLKKMIINLPSHTKRLRFLDLEAHLVPFKPEYHDILESSRPPIRDAVIDIASKMEPDELNSISGKILLENRIKKRINQILSKKVIKDIYFSKFVIQ